MYMRDIIAKLRILGRNLEIIKERNDWSLTRMANESGIARGTLTDLIKNKNISIGRIQEIRYIVRPRIPFFYTILNISGGLGYSVEDLFDEDLFDLRLLEEQEKDRNFSETLEENNLEV